MREDPGLDAAAITACLDVNYGMDVVSLAFLPLGFDPAAAAYRALLRDGSASLVKVRFGPVSEIGVRLPAALVEAGVPNIRGPQPTRTGALWCPLDDRSGASVVVAPFIEGGKAAAVGMSDAQWRIFGSSLRAVHESGLGAQFPGLLTVDTFALPSAAVVRRLLAMLDELRFDSPAATRLATFWRENHERIRRLLARAEALGSDLRSRPFEPVLCHGDIHGANVLVGTDGRIFLIDWDGPPAPLLAPRERDLIFIVGSRIAGVVEPDDEDRFFEGYGPVAIDPVALAYYRYERIIEDLGTFGESVFGDQNLGEEARAEEVDLSIGLFDPDGDVARAEIVSNRWRGG